MDELLSFFAYGELADIFKVADSLTNLYYDNGLGCGYQDISRTIHQRCAEDPAKCKFGAVANSLFTTHIIETMGSMTAIVNGVTTFEWQVDDELIYDQTLTIGKSAGSLLALAFDL